MRFTDLFSDIMDKVMFPTPAQGQNPDGIGTEDSPQTAQLLTEKPLTDKDFLP